MTTPWQKRTKRLAYAVGAATSVYLVASYALDRMRQSRIKGLKERKAKDL
jgi:peroxin-3